MCTDAAEGEISLFLRNYLNFVEINSIQIISTIVIQFDQWLILIWYIFQGQMSEFMFLLYEYDTFWASVIMSIFISILEFLISRILAAMYVGHWLAVCFVGYFEGVCV